MTYITTPATNARHFCKETKYADVIPNKAVKSKTPDNNISELEI